MGNRPPYFLKGQKISVKIALNSRQVTMGK